jgi:hypothetical protein
VASLSESSQGEVGDNYIYQYLGIFLKRQIVDRIKESEFYAIMIDESTNISIQKKLSICVRYVVNGESQTEFLANVKIDNGYAHTIVRHLVAKLESLNIDKSKMVSLATDGTAAMLGLSYTDAKFFLNAYISAFINHYSIKFRFLYSINNLSF